MYENPGQLKGFFTRRQAIAAFTWIFCVFSLGVTSLAQDFAVAPTVSQLTIHPGDKNVELPVTLTGTSAGPVSITLTGLPSGITVSPLTLTAGSTGTLQVSASVAADQEAFPALNASDPDTATSTVNVLALSGSMQATAPLALTVSLENPSFQPDSSKINLLVARIDTAGVAIDEKGNAVPGTITITSADGQTSYLPGSVGSDNTANFQVHGNTTAEMPKKPYDLKLNTSVDLLQGLGLQCPYVTSSGKSVCDKSKSYVLLANYDDKTMLRDWAASALANAIPFGGSYLSEAANSPSPSGTSTLMPWAPHSLFVELYLNGEYEGTYQLIEEVKADSHRVDMTEMAETDVSGNALTGGYLMEIDKRQAEDFTFITPENVYVGLTDPDYTPEVPEQTAYIQNYVDVAEAALFSSSYTDPVLGWRAYFDQAAAVNYYIVNDLMSNFDAAQFTSSVYLYKDRKNPLLYMGPVWDFDVSSGNVTPQASRSLDPTYPWMQDQSPWYSQWFTDPTFKAAATQQWNAVKGNGVLADWLASISAQATMLEQTQQNNFGRWPMQGIRVWPNAEAVGSYDGEVSYLLNWITLRMGYIDGFLNGKAVTQTIISLPSQSYRSGSPITLNAKVTGSNSLNGTVTFAYNSIVLGQSSLDSTGSATLTTTNLPPGFWYLEAYYNGDAKDGISGAASAPVTVLAPLVESATNLTASSNLADAAAPVTLTAVVVGTGSQQTPTGTISFTANGTAVGSANLNAAGTATLTTSALLSGDLVLQASYSGDATYAQSSSNTAGVDVKSAATVSLGSLGVTYDGNAHPVTATTTPAGLNVSITYNGSSSAPTAPGTYAVVATILDGMYSGSASGTLTIAKETATVSLGNLSATYDGTTHAVSAITVPSGLNVTFTYNGVNSAPTTPGSYAVTGTITDTIYAGSATGTLTINKGIASVVLTGLSASYDGTVHNVTATTVPAGLNVSLAYNGSPTAPTSPGSYAVVGTVVNSLYAGSATGTFTVGKANATLTLSALTATYDGSSHPVVATSVPAGLNVAITYNGLPVAPTTAGTYAVVASISDPDYSGTASGTLTIGKAAATISWAAPAAITYGSALSSTQLNATANVAGTVVFTPASGAILLGGTQQLSAQWIPSDGTNYTAVTKSVSIAVDRQGSATAISASTASGVPNQPVILTGTVTPASGGAPGGTVAFYDGGTLIGTQPVANGVAVLSANLASGSHNVSASYSGDGNYLGSPSAGALGIAIAPLDFTLAIAGESEQNISPGQQASFSLSLAPLYGVYPGPVSIQVAGLPSGYSAAAQVSISPALGSETVPLIIAPNANLTENLRKSERSGAVLLMCLLLPFGCSRRAWRRPLLTLALGIFGYMAIGGIAGCANAPVPAIYPLSVTATSGSMQHTVTATLTVR